MQPRTNTTRTLTSAQLVALLQDSPDPLLTGGLELVDLGLNLVEDISDDLLGGEVTRNSYATMHGSLTINVARVLDWGAALIRPYLAITGTVPGQGRLSARFNLGVYHPTIPETVTGASVPTWGVGGYDILWRLAQPVGDAYAIAAGDPYLAAVEQILLARGYQAYVINQVSAATVAPADRTWVFDETTTWLTIVNDLLSSIGYAGIWSDWDGRLRCEPYILPQARANEWVYSDDQATTMLGVQRTIVRDYTDAPNRWVTYRSNNVDDVAPVEGNGIVTIQNDNIGDTSVTARGGVVITKVTGVDAADQPSLIAQANAIAQTDMDIPRVITGTLPVANPLHWHFDRVYLRTAEYLGDVQCTEWNLKLPPDTGEMTFTFREVTQ